MVQALQEKVKAEQDSRMRRALEDLERNARLESERARQMFEAQQVWVLFGFIEALLNICVEVCRVVCVEQIQAFSGRPSKVLGRRRSQSSEATGREIAQPLLSSA